MRAAPPRTHRSRLVSPPSSRTAPPPCGRGDSPRHSAPLRTARIPTLKRSHAALGTAGGRGGGAGLRARPGPGEAAVPPAPVVAPRAASGYWGDARRPAGEAPPGSAPRRSAPSHRPQRRAGERGGGRRGRRCGRRGCGAEGRGSVGGVAGNGRPRALRAPGGRSAGGWGGAALLYSQ